MVEQDLSARAYAIYSLALFFDDADCVHQPANFRHVCLHRAAGYILGMGAKKQPPRFELPDESRHLAELHVCIAVQSSAQCRCWNKQRSLLDFAKFSKQSGYRVICIDQKPVHGNGILWNQISHGAEDETGGWPLAERARWLRHAAALIECRAACPGWPGQRAVPWS